MYKNTRSLLRLLALVALLTGCDAFTTRTPERPGSSTVQFDQPVSELIVVSNMLNAIRQKNTDAFMLCLADTAHGYVPPSSTDSSHRRKQVPALVISSPCGRELKSDKHSLH